MRGREAVDIPTKLTKAFLIPIEPAPLEGRLLLTTLVNPTYCGKMEGSYESGSYESVGELLKACESGIFSMIRNI